MSTWSVGIGKAEARQSFKNSFLNGGEFQKGTTFGDLGDMLSGAAKWIGNQLPSFHDIMYGRQLDGGSDNVNRF